jgi:hypothetical protein
MRRPSREVMPVAQHGSQASQQPIGDVALAAIVQVIAGLADGAQRRVSRRHAGQRHGFLWPEGAGWDLCVGHIHLLKIPLFSFARGEQLVELGFIGVVIEVLV